YSLIRHSNIHQKSPYQMHDRDIHVQKSPFYSLVHPEVNNILLNQAHQMKSYLSFQKVDLLSKKSSPPLKTHPSYLMKLPSLDYLAKALSVHVQSLIYKNNSLQLHLSLIKLL